MNVFFRFRNVTLAIAGLLTLATLPLSPAEARRHAHTAKPPVTSADQQQTPVSLVPMAPNVSPDAANGMVTTEISLESLQPDPKPQKLQFDHDGTEFYFPISIRFKPVKASLHLDLTNSIALLDTRSQLRVYIGDALVAQLPLHGSQPHLIADIDIPVEALKPGYNDLKILAIQHYINECEDPNAPELWTEIDTHRSHLTLAGGLIPLHPKLADLDDLLGPGVGGLREIDIASPKASPDNSLLKYGALISQALAFRLQYREPKIGYVAVHAATTPPAPGAQFPQLDQTDLKGRDIILVGTRDELTPLLPADLTSQISDGFLGTYALDNDPSRLLLIVSGRTETEVAKAASALSVLNFPFDNVQSSTVSKVVVPDQTRFVQTNGILPGKSYLFSDLNFQTTTAQSSFGIEFPVSFTLPADVHALEGATVDMALNFSYGAGLDDRSVINIFIDHTFERAIRLDQADGAVFHGYMVSIPLRSFKPGRNTIRFEVALMSHNLGKCQDVSRRDNMLITMFDSSSITFPGAARIATQPDLLALARTGFPLATGAHGQDLDVAVASTDVDSMVATWEIVGKLAQTTGILMSSTNYHFGITSSARHQLVVGPVGGIDPSLLQNSGLDLADGLAGTNFLTYRSQNTPATGPLTAFQEISDLLPSRMPEVSNKPLSQNTGDLGDLGAIFSFESPYVARHAVVVVTAMDSSILRDRVNGLITPAIWTQLMGDVAVWHDVDDPVEYASVAKPFTIGDRTTVTYFAYYVTDHPLPWIIIVLAAVTGLAFVTMIMLRRRRRKYHPHADELH